MNDFFKTHFFQGVKSPKFLQPSYLAYEIKHGCDQFDSYDMRWFFNVVTIYVVLFKASYSSWM
jgi:hypothetical protein